MLSRLRAQLGYILIYPIERVRLKFIAFLRFFDELKRFRKFIKPYKLKKKIYIEKFMTWYIKIRSIFFYYLKFIKEKLIDFFSN